MSEKFEKIVNAPHRDFGRVRRHIGDTAVTTKSDRAIRAVGVGVFGLAQFLFWAAKYIALDNHLTRAGERVLGNMRVGKNKAGQDKKLSAFAHRHPNLSSHILYYMMLAMVAGGTKVYYSNTQSNDDENVTPVELTVGMDENVFINSANSYGGFVKKMEPLIDPFIAYLILPESVHKNAAGLHTPYNSKDGRITIGYGSTRTPDGKSVTMDTPPLTDEQARDWVRQHLYTETFPLMYAYSVMYPDVKMDTPQDALFIMSLLYNAGSELIETGGSRTLDITNLVKERGDDLSAHDIANLFRKNPVTKLTGFGKLWLRGTPVKDLDKELSRWIYSNGVIARGLYVRRFVELGVGLGRLTPQQCLDCSAGQMYEYGKKVNYNSNHVFFDKHGNVNVSTYKDFNKYLSDKSKINGKIRDFLPQEMVQNIESGKSYAEFKKLTDAYNMHKGAHTAPAVSAMTRLQMDAQAAFDDGEFKKAAQLFGQLTVDYPDVASYRNDLAATYNKLGRYDDAIAQVREIVHRIHDKGQYAAAYYNAGVAYEKQGNLRSALDNYKLAVDKGNRRVQRDVTRVSNQLQKGNGQKQNRTSFNAGRNNVQNSFIRKLNMYNKNTNNMA